MKLRILIAIFAIFPNISHSDNRLKLEVEEYVISVCMMQYAKEQRNDLDLDHIPLEVYFQFYKDENQDSMDILTLIYVDIVQTIGLYQSVENLEIRKLFYRLLAQVCKDCTLRSRNQ